MIDLQEKVESSQAGRAVITGVMIFILASLVAANIPQTSYLQQKLNSIVQPVRDSVGLDQTWSVFAPEPRRETFALDASITYNDGTSEVWAVPTGDPYIAEYRTYHWQKWSENVRLDDMSWLWSPLAVWLARSHNTSVRHPIQISLTRRWYILNPPGTHPSRGPWNEFTFYSLAVTPSVLAGGS
ncbi:MAG: hypothetical protein E6G46_03240 [Actinobacteria bacterium]|nr:MAG: hypothetical protein E6G46_03240 [Actinomycetota bacterium]